MVSAPHKRYTFNTLSKFLFQGCPTFNVTNLQVLPTMASIPDIKAVSYDVCGLVQTFDLGTKQR